MIDLANLFGLGASAAPKAPTYSPEIQAILEQAGYAPEDPAEAKRRALSTALASFGKSLASSTQDFLPALAGAAGSGAVDYNKMREGQEDDRRKSAIDLMKQVFGFDKAQDLNAYRQGSLDERLRHNQVTEGQGQQRIHISLDQGNRRLDQGDRRLDQGDRRLDQGDVRLDQGQQKIDETGRYHDIQNENADDRTAILERRLEDAYGFNEERLRQGRERIALQQEAGKRDAARLKAQIDSGYYAKGAKGDLGSSKQRNQELDTRAKILRVISEKAKSLGMNDPGLEFREPDTWKANKLELEEYARSIYQEFGYDERGMPIKAPDQEQPVPAPNETPQPNAGPDRSTWGRRPDGSAKGSGFLGVLKRPDGGVSTEISISTDAIGGKDFPLLVPTLTPDEVKQILAIPVDDPGFFKKVPRSAIRKAEAFAEQRVAAGKSPFADESENRSPAPAQSGGSTTGMGSRTDPVRNITSKEQFDALPSGAWYVNPSDGKSYRKK